MVGNPPSPLPLHVPSKNDSGVTAGWMDGGAGADAGGSSPSISMAVLTLFSLVRVCVGVISFLPAEYTTNTPRPWRSAFPSKRTF